MRIRHLAWIVTLSAGACGGSCAGNTNGTDDPPPPPPPAMRTKAYVSVDGDDAADGSEVTPFNTIARALDDDADIVIVRPGIYVEPEITIARRVSVEGEYGAVLTGRVLVANDDVRWQRVDVMGGMSINLAERVVVSTATISPGTRDDTISIGSGSATLEGLVLKCGPETCVQVTTSTASLSAVTMSPVNASKRGLRAESSSVAVSTVEVRGTTIAQLQASGGSWMRVRGAKLDGAMGSGLVALSSRVLADDVFASGANRFGFLAQTATVTLRGAQLGAAVAITAGVQGGNVSVFDSVMTGSREGTLSVSAWRDQRPTVRLSRTRVEHGRYEGASVSSGTLRVEGGRFVGDATAPDTVMNADAIVASGIETVLEIDGATIEDTAGTAILGTSHLRATITATIARPRLTGIFFENVRVHPVVVRAGRVSGCVRESGIVALDSERVRVEGVTITGCAEAGVLAGEDSDIAVVGARAVDNAGFGYAAFGGSTLRLSGSSARGSAWATFSTCADGAAVVDAGGNQLSGPTTECP